MAFEDGVTNRSGLSSVRSEFSFNPYMPNSSAIKLCLVIAFAAALLSPTSTSAAESEPAIVAAPPGVGIDIYQVSPKRTKGARFVNTKMLPKLGYVGSAPVLQIERLRSVKKIHTKGGTTTIESADGRKRSVSNNIPAIEMTLTNADATAFAELMRKSVGGRLLMEAEGTPIYAPLVRDALPASTLTFSLADDAQLEEVYRKLARFVKK